MATVINLKDLRYPDHEVQHQIMCGDWPELSTHQWAILAGHPMPFMAWNIEVISREMYESSKRKMEP